MAPLDHEWFLIVFVGVHRLERYVKDQNNTKGLGGRRLKACGGARSRDIGTRSVTLQMGAGAYVRTFHTALVCTRGSF